MKALVTLAGLMLVASDQLVSVSVQPQTSGVKTKTSSDSTTTDGRRAVPETDTRRSNQNRLDQKQRALELLDQLSEMAKPLETSEWTLRVRAHIADLLWNSDKERARGNFEEIFHAVDSIRPPDAADRNSSATRMPTRYLRSEVLGLISTHDPDMAETLIRTVDTDADSSQARSAAAIEKEKSFLSLQMATALIDSNPSRAADLIVSSLESGLTSWFALTLQVMRQQNPALADEVVARALSVAQADKEHYSKNISVLAASLFPVASGPMVTAFGDEDEQGVAVGFDLRAFGSGPTPGPAVTKQFLDFAYRTFMQTPVPTDRPGAQTEHDLTQALESSMTANMLLPMFDRYLPEQSAMLRVRLNEIGKSLNFGEGQSFETLMNFFNFNGSAEELLNRAQCQKEPDFRDALYQQAAQVAARNGETDKIASILEKVNDERVKSSIRSTVAHEVITGALARNDLEAAHQDLKDLSDPSQQAWFLTQMAQKLVGQKDDTRAAQWLSEAEELASKADATGKVYTLLSIAEAAAQLNSERGFSLMTSVVKDINQAATRSRETADTRSGQDGATLSQDPDSLFANTLLQNKAFASLARADFDVALALAQSILPQQSSIAAQLGVCRGLLARSADERTGNSKKRGEER